MTQMYHIPNSLEDDQSNPRRRTDFESKSNTIPFPYSEWAMVALNGSSDVDGVFCTMLQCDPIEVVDFNESWRFGVYKPSVKPE